MDWIAPILAGLAALVAALWTWNVIAARTYRSRLMNAYRDLSPAGESSGLPNEVGALVEDFREFGFDLLESHVTRDGRLVILLYNVSESSIGEIADFTDIEGVEGLTTEITNVLEGGRGLLCTGNTAGPSIHPGELKQSFPGAPLDELVRQHRAAVEQLYDLSLGMRHMTVDEATTSREEWFDLLQEHIRSAPTRSVLDWIRDARTGYAASSGPTPKTQRCKRDSTRFSTVSCRSRCRRFAEVRVQGAKGNII